MLCNEMGMDPISLGSTIACAMEMYEAGIVTLKDTGGLDLSFGNPDTIVDLTRKIGVREGIGDRLALGSYRYAASFWSSGILDDGEEAGDASLRSARSAGHRFGICDLQSWRLPRERLHHRGGSAGFSHETRPARYQGQAFLCQAVSRSHRSNRRVGRVHFRHLWHEWRQLCGDAYRADWYYLLHRRLPQGG